MISYTYQIEDSLYINITNRCNADCVFCDRKGAAVIKGFHLKMSKSQEPQADFYINEINNPADYKEIVFCGYGEPTIRWDVVKKISEYVKSNCGSTRLNTNGHGNYINGRDITPEFKNLIDTVSISLNSTDPEQYAELMRVEPFLHNEMIEFALKASKYSKVIMSIVDLSSVDKKAAEEFVIGKTGLKFRERKYFKKRNKNEIN